MPATIFAGSKVKALKSTLSLNGGADVISSATDPTSVAVDAAIGSLLLNTTSGKLYKKLDAGSSTNWQEVGAGTGGKNYITKGSFDTASTSGWSLAASTLDATTKLPNQASGSWTAAAGTLSITTVGGGSQLSLLPYSLSLVSSAATTAGNMLVSDALALDLEAQSSIQTFSFFYKVASGSPTLAGNSTNSIAVAVYDVTNGAWIDPAGRYNVVQISGVAKCAGTFQVPSNCTSVRLAVYFPNASAGAITVYLDDFYLGPQVVQYGAAVTEWKDFPSVAAGTLITATTTNPTYGTVAYNRAQWRQVGSDMEIRWDFRQTTAGTAGSGTYLFNLPAGRSIDTAKVAVSSTADDSKSLGVFDYTDPAGNAVGIGYATAYSSTQLKFVMQTQSASGSIGTISSTYGTLSNSTLQYSLKAKVPILGWSSSVQMSNDTDTRVVAASASRSTTQALTANVTDVVMTTAAFDTHAAYNTSTGVYVAPVPGYYAISGVLSITVANSCTFVAYVDGSSRVTLGSISNSVGFPLSGTVYLNAGQSLTIRADTTVTLQNARNAVSIQRLSGPSAIAASETVAARYQVAAGVATSSTAPVNFATKVFDTHGAVTTGAAWKFTAPISGKFLVSTTGFLAASTTNFDLYKNAVFNTTLHNLNATGATSGSCVLELLAGDYIDVRGNSSVTTGSVGSAVYICITRIGS